MALRRYSLIVSPQVYTEMAAAYLHYLEVSEDLADRFMFQVGLALERMESLWSTHQIKYMDLKDAYRVWKIPYFPYAFHFWVDEVAETLFIEALFHEKQESPLGKAD